MSSDVTDEAPAGKPGLIDSVKNLAATLVAIGQTRLELLSNDLEEERAWLSSMLIWTLVSFFSAALAVILATLLIVIIFWDIYRLLAIGVMVGIFILAAVYAWRVVQDMSRRKPRLFSASIGELSKDRDQLAPGHE